MRSVFVTGTDTDAGKTTVSVAILQAAAARGLVAAAMKPVESGCRRVEGALLPADAERLTSSASPTLPRGFELTCPYRFEPPVAPSVAAHDAGLRVELDVIARAHATLAAYGPDLLLVEGAGGLLVPLDDERGTTIADLAVRLGAPVLVVARDRLGVINHTLLTLEVAAARGLTVLGVVLNVVDEREVVPSNLQQLRRHAAVPVLGRMPAHGLGVSRQQLGAVAERELDLSPLLGPVRASRAGRP